MAVQGPMVQKTRLLILAAIVRINGTGVAGLHSSDFGFVPVRIEPGRFSFAVRFEIAKGYRISWSNPGDVGKSTQVSFQVPEGFSVGPLQFPAPTPATSGSPATPSSAMRHRTMPAP